MSLRYRDRDAPRRPWRYRSWSVPHARTASASARGLSEIFRPSRLLLERLWDIVARMVTSEGLVIAARARQVRRYSLHRHVCIGSGTTSPERVAVNRRAPSSANVALTARPG